MDISFTIPAYNEEALLAKCISSIQRELSEGEYSAEIIVVNNTSTDRTREIALSFPDVRVVDEMQKGVRFARHAGFLASNGSIIANIDADIILPPGWLKTVMKEFQNESIIGLSGPYRYYDLSFLQRVILRIFDWVGFLYYLYAHFIREVDSMVCGGNLVIRRTALEQIGGYDTSIESSADDAYTLHCLEHIGVVRWSWNIPVYASGRRLAKKGIIRTYAQWVTTYFLILHSRKLHSEEYPDVR